MVLRDGGGCNKRHRQAVSKQGQRQAFSRQQAAMMRSAWRGERLPSKAGAHLAFSKLALIKRMRKLEHIVLRESKAFFQLAGAQIRQMSGYFPVCRACASEPRALLEIARRACARCRLWASAERLPPSLKGHTLSYALALAEVCLCV